MNETIEIIKRRRSTRKYKSEQIAKNEIEAIIEAGICAPSGMNQQKWHFTIVQNKETMVKLIETVKQNIINSGVESLAIGARNPEFNPFYEAPTLIILSGAENSKFAQIDCGAAAENMAIAAESLGIGSCMIASSVFIVSKDNGEALKEELGIPEDYKPIISLTLGYKAEGIQEVIKRKENVINYI